MMAVHPGEARQTQKVSQGRLDLCVPLPLSPSGGRSQCHAAAPSKEATVVACAVFDSATHRKFTTTEREPQSVQKPFPQGHFLFAPDLW